MKGTLNSKGIYTGCISGVCDGSIKFCTKGGEGDGVIVRTNVLLKVGNSVGPNDFAIGIDTCLSEEYSNWFWSIICHWQFNGTFRATHRKFRIEASGPLKTLFLPMKGIAMRAAKSKKSYGSRNIRNVHGPQRMSNIH